MDDDSIENIKRQDLRIKCVDRALSIYIEENDADKIISNAMKIEYYILNGEINA